MFWLRAVFLLVPMVAMGGVQPGKSPVDFKAIPEVRILKGEDDRSLRDVAAIYHEGVFHLYLTLTEHDARGNVFWFTAQTESRDLVHWKELEKITPKDQNLNFSSPGNVIRFGNEWILCLQTYPIPNCKVTDVGKRTRFGNENARLWIMRSQDLRHWSKAEMLRTIPGCEKPFAKGMRMIDPYLVEDARTPGLWWCFFKRHGRIQGSTSRDLVHWQFQGETGCIGENPTVLRLKDEYLLVYSPANGTSFARSRDLRHWERIPGVETLGQKDWEWGRRGRLSAATVLDCRANPEIGKFIMFFHCTKVPEVENFYTHCSIGIAWSDDLKTWSWPGK